MLRVLVGDRLGVDVERTAASWRERLCRECVRWYWCCVPLGEFTGVDDELYRARKCVGFCAQVTIT